jgi:hypothetical protein
METKNILGYIPHTQPVVANGVETSEAWCSVYVSKGFFHVSDDTVLFPIQRRFANKEDAFKQLFLEGRITGLRISLSESYTEEWIDMVMSSKNISAMVICGLTDDVERIQLFWDKWKHYITDCIQSVSFDICFMHFLEVAGPSFKGVRHLVLRDIYMTEKDLYAVSLITPQLHTFVVDDVYLYKTSEESKGPESNGYVRAALLIADMIPKCYDLKSFAFKMSRTFRYDHAVNVTDTPSTYGIIFTHLANAIRSHGQLTTIGLDAFLTLPDESLEDWKTLVYGLSNCTTLSLQSTRIPIDAARILCVFFQDKDCLVTHLDCSEHEYYMWHIAGFSDEVANLFVGVSDKWPIECFKMPMWKGFDKYRRQVRIREKI